MQLKNNSLRFEVFMVVKIQGLLGCDVLRCCCRISMFQWAYFLKIEARSF